MKYDDVFRYIGDSGTYQGLVFLITALHSFWGVESMAMNFIGYTAEHWCKVPQLQKMNHSMQKYISVPEDDEGGYDSCKVYNLNYSMYSTEDFLNWDRSIMVNNTTMTVGCSDWVHDQSIFESTIVSRFNLVCGRSFMNQLISTCFFAGVLIGAVASGNISDRIGRRLTIFIFVIFKVGVGFLGVFAPNYVAQVLGRFLLGIGSTGVFLTTYVLLSELVGPTYRSLYGVGFQMAFSIGFMVVPGLAYNIRNDRWLQFTMHLPNIAFLSYYWILPESPRWLILKGRYTEAQKILQKMATVNKKKLPEDFDLVKMGEENTSSVEQKPCGDMMQYPRMRTRTCLVDFHWFVDSLMYYALSLNASGLSGDIFVNTLISGAVEIPANLLSFFGMNWKKIGRRLTCSLSLVAAGVFSFLTIPMILIGNGQGSTAFSMIGKAFTTIGFTGIYVYSTEIFPTETRNSAVGVASMFARVSGMAAPYVGGPLGNVWRPLPSLIFGVFSTAAGLGSLALPETLGYKMFDTIEEAEAFNMKRAKSDDNEIDTEKPRMGKSNLVGIDNTLFQHDL